MSTTLPEDTEDKERDANQLLVISLETSITDHSNAPQLEQKPASHCSILCSYVLDQHSYYH